MDRNMGSRHYGNDKQQQGAYLKASRNNHSLRCLRKKERRNSSRYLVHGCFPDEGYSHRKCNRKRYPSCKLRRNFSLPKPAHDFQCFRLLLPNGARKDGRRLRSSQRRYVYSDGPWCRVLYQNRKSEADYA